jgi:hypothetical protein
MLSIFDIDNNFSLIKNESILNENTYVNNILIKSNVGKGKNKVFASYISPSSPTLMIFVFDFDLFRSSPIK